MPIGAFITATEARSGKSAISLGVMELLQAKVHRVGFFRPIIDAGKGTGHFDPDINLILSYFDIDMKYEEAFAFTSDEAARFISDDEEEDLIAEIIQRYNDLADRFDFVLCEGTDFMTSTAAFEFDINGEIAKNLGTPVLLVANASGKGAEDTVRSIELALDSLDEKGCTTIGTIVIRCEDAERQAISDGLKDNPAMAEQLTYYIVDEPFLGRPTVREVVESLGAEVMHGDTQLNRHVSGYTVAAMELPNFLTRIESGSLIIVPGDRSDIIVGAMASVSAGNPNDIAGLLLTGGLKPQEPIWDLIQGFPNMVPVLSVAANTFPTAMQASGLHSKIAPTDKTKIARALATFENGVDVDKLGERLVKVTSHAITPRMFEFELMRRAKRGETQHIVLPEGEEDRILQAADTLLSREVVNLTLLGNKRRITERTAILGLDISGADVVDPATSDRLDEYADTYFELRKHKGVTREAAHDVMLDVNFFGAMMVYKREVDGMVSGAVHTTAATIRPALQIIKTKPGFSIVSSVFFMVLDRVLVYGDCAVNTNPTAEQLAEIALSSAETARAFGIEPVVALLSYSSGESGEGEDVDKVRKAAQIAQQRAKKMFPGLKLEGPLQYDAAVDPKTAKTKMPDSEVAGKATVLVFPDLNTGNNTYKAVQRSAGAMAIGPVLQGLKYPVNDLSRGALVDDIVNTVVITAIQAQQNG